MSKINKKQYEAGHIVEYVNAICSQYQLDSGQVKAFLLFNFPELKDKQFCPNCTAGMKTFWHRLSPGLVGDLIKAIEFVKKSKKNQFHLANDLNLTKTEYNNFQKLRFHGLIAHVEGQIGYWLITARGGKFLRGEISVPVGVRTFRNIVKEHTEETTHIRDFQKVFPAFETKFAYEYIPQSTLL